MQVEVRATGLKAVRKQRGLTQDRIGKAVGLSRNYIPALEEGARRPGRNVQTRLIQYFGCRFEDLFQVVLVDPDNRRETILYARERQSR